jgi:predicted AAA+ superfamily ATPase
MLYRKMYDHLLSWSESKNPKALLITGARQIGKTYLVRAFGKAHFKNFVEINFINEPKAEAIFAGNLDIETLTSNLTAYLRKPLEPHQTLIFLDEIQECPAARTAIKFLVEDGRFRLIESGSLLGVNYKEVKSYPVGSEEILQMYPMDFEEFILANGIMPETIATLRNAFEQSLPLSDSLHQTMIELFRYYMIVGGMPEVVQSFVDRHDIGDVLRLQKNILALYRQDIARYALSDKIRVKELFDRIPAELNTKNKRFMLSDIDKSARFNRYESSFMWLTDAGVALPCYNITEPVVPLRLNEQNNLFKFFLSDTGLLCAASLGNVQFDILQGDLSVNMGSILENTFAQLLRANGFDLRFLNKKKFGEIDFIVQRGKDIIPIEIKSGNDYLRHAALDKLLDVEAWDIPKAYVFCKGPVSVQGPITYLPWYLVMFLVQENPPDHLQVKVDLRGY